MSGFNLVKLIDPIQLTIAGTFTPRGAYDNATDYAVGDQVDYNGSSYIMYVDAAAGTLPTDDTKWGLIAEKGDTGATGATGASGVVQAVVAGTNIDVDATDPANPVVSVETLTLADISDITATAAEVNVLDGIPGTLTATELGYVDGVTSAIQTQLNAKVENLSSFDTDDLTEGSTNLYSQWEEHIYGGSPYLEPITTHGLVIGNDLHSSVPTTFQGASAIYNGTPDGASAGVNYNGILAYGSGFAGFGALSILGRAEGTAASPTYVPDQGYLGGLVFTGFDGTDWAYAGANHIFPGLFGQAQGNVTGGVLEADVWLGGILTKMIGFESDTNAIKFNAAQLDSDITFYSDTGTTLVLDGGTTQAIFAAGSAAAPSITFTGDVDTGLHYVGANQFSFDTAGVSRMQVSSTEVVVNPGKIASNDFKVHGDTVDNIIFADVSADMVQMRKVPRVGAASDATSITPTGDSYDFVTQANTQALGTLTINAPTGTPINGQELTLRIKSTNAHTYSFNAIYRGSLDTPLPLTHSGSSLTDYLKFIYNSADSKWDLAAISGGY